MIIYELFEYQGWLGLACYPSNINKLKADLGLTIVLGPEDSLKHLATRTFSFSQHVRIRNRKRISKKFALQLISVHRKIKLTGQPEIVKQLYREYILG